MNRREFIKYGLGGLFGMGLTWAGVVRGEEPGRIEGEILEVLPECEIPYLPQGACWSRTDSDLGALFSQNGQIDWPRTKATLEEIGILPRKGAAPVHDGCDKCAWKAECEIGNISYCSASSEDGHSWDYSEDTGGAPHRITVSDLPAIAITPELRLSGDGYGVIATDTGTMFITYDEEIWHSLTEESATHGNAAPYVSRIASADRDAGIVTFELVEANTGGPPPNVEEKVSWTLYREGKNIWSVGIDGSVAHSGDNGETWREITTGTAGEDIAGVMWDKWGLCPSNGAAIGFSAQHPEGRWVYWDIEGSDENGTGTTKDPVATQACAQSIADLGNVAI